MRSESGIKESDEKIIMLRASLSGFVALKPLSGVTWNGCWPKYKVTSDVTVAF